MRKVFFHVDIDAFFASVEQRDNPDLAGKPVIVGAAPGHRGVVSTCSYEARAYGVHSAMPISEAFRRCPGGIYLPVRMRRYSEVSRVIIKLLSGFTPDLVQISIDEAMLDMTGTEKLWGGPRDTALLIKKSVREATGLTVSIGGSENRYIAKIASGLKKPDGFVFVEAGREREFMRSLPMERLWGAGEKTRKALREIGISTIADLQSVSAAALGSKFGKAGAKFLLAAASGDDPGIMAGEAKSRSMSGERTFAFDTISREAVIDILRMIADDLAARLLDATLKSCTLGIKLRFGDFSSITRQCTRNDSYASSNEIYEDAVRLLDANWDGRDPLRLVGLGLHGLSQSGLVQGELFLKENPKSEEARKAVQDIEKRGVGHLVRARFLDPGKAGEEGKHRP